MKRQKSFENGKATLYLVATPIGNLEELTPRAIRILNEVDIIAAEDTRNTMKLLSHFDIKTRCIAHHSHNEHESAKGLLNLLDEGKNIAVVSDAGYPLVSDPGQVIVQLVIEAGYNVVPISGASAGLNALVASGICAQPYMFVGFLKASENERRKECLELKGIRQTLIFYEKKGIFLPAYKNEKGYRFYLMSQLDIIATIQSLQKIGLSLEEIKDYIEHRNAQSTYELFSNKINTLKEIITTYHKMINMMETKCQLITKANQILTDMVYIEYRDEIKIIKSDYIPFNSKEINQYKILGEHIKYRKKQNHSLGHAISGMVEWKKMLKSKRKKTFYQYYYTILDNQLEDENYDIIPSGNYLVIYHKGTYETSYQSYHLFLDYAKKNHLVLDDIAYDESLIDELTEANPQNYITQISVKFKKELE